jgi:hypothetical protein
MLESKGVAMENPVHPLHDLFGQLGLPDDHAFIEGFITRHGPLPDTIRLAEAPFWTPQQAQFLGEAIREDADWAVIVDQFDVLMRVQPTAGS